MVSLLSFAKINLGLQIGPARPDGFHELRTVYQTLALHDVVRVDVVAGEGIEIRCGDPRVPLDVSNTCYKIAERVLALVKEQQIPRGLKSARDDNSKQEPHRAPEGAPFQGIATGSLPGGSVPNGGVPEAGLPGRGASEASISDGNEAGAPGRGWPGTARAGRQPGIETHLYGTAHAARVQYELQSGARGKIVIEIEKRLPVQGGMGAASSNAVAAMLAMERALGVTLSPEDKLRIAAEVGSDLPLFLIGGTVLGVGRGEEVFALPDLPPMPVVVVTPPVGVSTPRAFARWDELAALEAELTHSRPEGTINQFSQRVFAWLGTGFPQVGRSELQAPTASGVPARGGNRAETPLLDLVRAGIENDFEKVVFPEYPDLREVKAMLLREGARYASLSGSGSTLYGLFETSEEAQSAAARMSAAGHAAVATTTLTREEYWKAATSC